MRRREKYSSAREGFCKGISTSVTLKAHKQMLNHKTSTHLAPHLPSHSHTLALTHSYIVTIKAEPGITVARRMDRPR